MQIFLFNFLFFILSVQDSCFASRLIGADPQTQQEIVGFKEEREKVLELGLFSCDFFFVRKESRESAWQMGVLI